MQEIELRHLLMNRKIKCVEVVGTNIKVTSNNQSNIVYCETTKETVRKIDLLASQATWLSRKLGGNGVRIKHPDVKKPFDLKFDDPHEAHNILRRHKSNCHEQQTF